MASGLIRSRLPPSTHHHIFSDGHVRFRLDRHPVGGTLNFALVLVRLGYLSSVNPHC